MSSFQTIDIKEESGVAIAMLNRPAKANALDRRLWFELEALANWANDTPSVRVLVLGAHGNHFCAGIDFELVQSLAQNYLKRPEGRRQEQLYKEIRLLQAAFSAFERCSKPVLAAIHGSCYGGGIDLITACDLRYASENALFCVKEVDLAIVADIGTIQRLPSLIGEGHARELSYTARIFNAAEAHRLGLVNQVYSDQEAMIKSVLQTARVIASKSPLAIRNTKMAYNYARDNNVESGLDMVARLNAGILFSNDFRTAMAALQNKVEPMFDD